MALPAVDRLADVPDDVCRALKDACAEAGYDDELIMSLASLALSAAGSEFLPVVHHVLRRRGDKAATLARLFAYSDVVDTQTVSELLGEAPTQALREAGLLIAADEPEHGLRSCFHLRPLDGLWLLADDPGGGRDAVMPPLWTVRPLLVPPPRSTPG